MTDFVPLATQLVDDKLGQSGVARMPAVIHEWCVMVVAKRLNEIDSLTNGVAQYGPDGETSYISSDPLKPVLTTLNKYRGLGAVG